jgi:hypothetical protein
MKRFKMLLVAALFALTTIAGAGAAHAQLAVDFTGYADTFTKDPLGANINIVGWQFTTTSELYVSRLGYFDLNATDAHQVALYDAAGNSVASVNMAAGQGTLMNSFFRMADIAGVTLQSGKTYTLAATVGADAYTADTTGTQFGGTNSFAGLKYNGVTYGTDVFDDTTQNLPLNWTSTSSAGVTGAFGPNMDATPTPIPAAAWLLGSGLLGLAGIRRRNK